MSHPLHAFGPVTLPLDKPRLQQGQIPLDDAAAQDVAVVVEVLKAALAHGTVVASQGYGRKETKRNKRNGLIMFIYL